MNLFLAKELDETGGFLGKEESHHAHRVLRLSNGAQILTTQGQGIIYISEIVDSSKTQVQFTNKAIFKEEVQPAKLHIAIAPTKSNDRFEFFLEKATEIGISEITPIICHNSERKIYKTERGQKIISSGAKQSLACWWPKFNEAIKLPQFQTVEQSTKFIAHCERDDMPNILKELSSISDVVMLIGPEGDFSPQEIEWAKNQGFAECSLGPKRLRTETAGLAVALAFAMK